MTGDRSRPGGRPDPGDDAPTFDAPWQARAFALAVAITDGDGTDGDTDWRAFQSRLVEEIEVGDAAPEPDDPEAVYYHQWLAALERVLVDRGLLDPGEFADRVAEFEAGERTAHEFVEGDPHAHADRLPEGHAEGSDHDHGGEGHGHDHGGHDHDGRDHDHDHDHDREHQDRGGHDHHDGDHHPSNDRDRDGD